MFTAFQRCGRVAAAHLFLTRYAVFVVKCSEAEQYELFIPFVFQSSGVPRGNRPPSITAALYRLTNLVPQICDKLDAVLEGLARSDGEKGIRTG
ncbi:hypothetical protein Q1695_015160 [Nippostrongylus brasiliensis]|nr:hypothetical protein Q1695_015160 [Nippostrongylus brasiliensis]